MIAERVHNIDFKNRNYFILPFWISLDEKERYT